MTMSKPQAEPSHPSKPAREAGARRLHIGGKVAAPGWEVMNAIPGPHVDHVGDAADLSRFADRTFSVIYASHVVEHFDYRDELARTLREWHRVLAPGGLLHVSVPDLDILCRMMLEREKLSVNERFMVMRMMFGGHVDEWDHHSSGLNMEFLTFFLHRSGFKKITRVTSFGLFKDTSEFAFKGTRISLNLTAEA
jgi:predicted SAM-dependent methyltransferase